MMLARLAAPRHNSRKDLLGEQFQYTTETRVKVALTACLAHHPSPSSDSASVLRRIELKTTTYRLCIHYT